MTDITRAVFNGRLHFSTGSRQSFLVLDRRNPTYQNDGKDFSIRAGRNFTETMRKFVNQHLPQGWRLYLHEEDAFALNPRWVLRWRRYTGDQLVIRDFVFRWRADWADGDMITDGREVARYRVDKQVKYDSVAVSKRRKAT